MKIQTISVKTWSFVHFDLFWLFFFHLLTVVQISNVIAIFKNVSIKNMVANIYVQDCVEHKTRQ